MVDRLDKTQAPAETQTPAPPWPPLEEWRLQSLVRVQTLPWLLLIVALALAAFLAWKAYGPEDHGDPLSTSLVAFEKQNRLTVFSAQLAPVVSSDDQRFFGTIRSKQVAVIPTRVDYTLNLEAVDRERLDWDEQARTLSVRLPALEIGTPNLDEGRAQYLREGIWITRDAQDKLTRDNTKLAEEQAREQARNPVLMGLARAAARDAVRQNLAIPLQVAGYGNVTVNVSFDGEAVPPR